MRTGRISSFQSMGAVDGPGLRCVVFLQGCTLRCAYCHNPETWSPLGGEEITIEALAAKIRRFKPYLTGGGVTVSGGEPLMQWQFVAELFATLHAEGIHTALDTAGIGDPAGFDTVLAETDLVICDMKFPDDARFAHYCKGDRKQTLAFLERVTALRVPLWLRQVIVPGINNNREDILALNEIGKQYPTLERIELLPFRRLCVDKYRERGIPFPLEDTPECPPETIAELQQLITI